jgi:ABC-type multidrug transport system, ATPase component
MIHQSKGDIGRGEIFALLGFNGAGKTTIVRILATLLKQDGGTAIVTNFDVASQPEHVRHKVKGHPQKDGLKTISPAVTGFG